MRELVLGQFAAIAVGLFFVALEYLRFRSTSDSPVLRAGLEGFRMWGFIAVTQIFIWLAIRSSDLGNQIACGVVSPIIAALIFNNAYLALHRMLLARPSS